MSVLIGLKVTCDGTIYEAPKQSPANNSKVTNLILAVFTGNGENQYEFVDVAFWGKDADLIMRYPVGHHIQIDCGKIAVNTYLDKDNKPRARLKINVAAWHSLDSLPKSNEQQPQSNTQPQPNVQSSIAPTQQTVSTPEQKKEVPLKEALNFRFTKGEYAGKTVAEVLMVNPAFIYKLCVNKRIDSDTQMIFQVSYSYWYNRTQKNKESQPTQQSTSKPIIEGAKRNVITSYSDSVPDEDLPF